MASLKSKLATHLTHFVLKEEEKKSSAKLSCISIKMYYDFSIQLRRAINLKSKRPGGMFSYFLDEHAKISAYVLNQSFSRSPDVKISVEILV